MLTSLFGNGQLLSNLKNAFKLEGVPIPESKFPPVAAGQTAPSIWCPGDAVDTASDLHSSHQVVQSIHIYWTPED